MTYAFRDWLNVDAAIVDDRPDMNEWLRSRAVPTSTRAIAVPAPRLAVLRHRSRTSRLRPTGAIAIAARCIGLCVMLGCVWLIVSGAL